MSHQRASRHTREETYEASGTVAIYYGLPGESVPLGGELLTKMSGCAILVVGVCPLFIVGLEAAFVVLDWEDNLMFVTICRKVAVLVFWFGVWFSNTVAVAGILFEADGDSGKIYNFTPSGVQSTFAAGLTPRGLAFASSGNLFAADQGSNSIYEFTPGGVKSTFATGLQSPAGLAFDSSGNLFVANSFGGSIYKYSPDGGQSVFATGLNGPMGLAFDSGGNLFEADVSSGSIYEFTLNGKTTFATGLHPRALAFDSSGDLFYNDANTIYEFTPSGTRSTFVTGFKRPTVPSICPYARAFLTNPLHHRCRQPVRLRLATATTSGVERFAL